MFNSSITIQGGAYTVPTQLKDILEKRMNIVFGRNGSGKSTIARAFREQQPDYQQKHPGRSFFLSFDGKTDSLPADVQERLLVFNEDFIDENVKFSSGGLKSIVRIGANAELAAPIKEAKDKIADLQKQMEPLEKERDALEGKGDGSIEKAEKKFKEGLKTQGGFLERLDRIEDKSHNLTGGLIDMVKNEVVANVDTFPIAEKAKALDAEIGRYKSYQGGSPIQWQAPSLAGLPDMDAVNGLLTQAVRPAAELNDREKAILDDITTVLASENFGDKTQKLIVESDRAYCPLCHQPLTADHKHTLEQRLLRFRDRQVEDFKDKVRDAEAMISPVTDTIPDIPAPDFKDDLERGHDAVTRLNALLADVSEALGRKYDNPFSPIPAVDKAGWDALVAECRGATAKVAEDVNAYNQKLQDKAQLLANIKKDNVTLAAVENRAWIKEIKQREARKVALVGDIEKLRREILAKQNALNALQGKQDQTDDAREQINNYLDIILGGGKLRLANNTKDSYKLQLKSGDTYIDIPPRAISSGERNALALAYFFACVMEKKDRDYNYSEPTLLVIDDPVSSFDAENKAGVISLLLQQCKKILAGNTLSKVLIFTHDFATLRTLCDSRSRMLPVQEGQRDIYFRLKPNHVLVSQLCDNIRVNTEYFTDLNSIFEFAIKEDPEDFDGSDMIGNTIRSFAENFATHTYKCKWMDLFSDDERTACLPYKIRDKVEAFAIKPVLNSESHDVNRVFGLSEVQRAARTLLVYMYCAQKDHLEAYLVGRNKDKNGWKMRRVEEWILNY